jgi:hypothetical protein
MVLWIPSWMPQIVRIRVCAGYNCRDSSMPESLGQWVGNCIIDIENAMDEEEEKEKERGKCCNRIANICMK